MTGGVLGVVSKKEKLASLIFDCLLGLQDRGQEYCGISTLSESGIKIRTHRGLVRETLGGDLEGLEGEFGIGATSSIERQPLSIYSLSPKPKFTLAFDGYITNASDLRGKILGNNHAFATPSQVELLGHMIASADSISNGLKLLLESIEGPCSLVLLSEEGIFAARDKAGFKPLVLGAKESKENSSYIIASEPWFFSNNGFEIVRDVEPGEIVFISQKGISSLGQLSAPLKICNFEWIYYANPNSVIEGENVANVRHKLGASLAKRDQELGILREGFYVGPVPNSGICHAEGYALESKLPNVEIFLPLRYGLRTYIIPNTHQRITTKQRKLIPLVHNVNGRNIILVDDSIRSGITIRDLIEQLKESGAKSVHVRIASPPSVRYCPYAQPPQKEEEFIAQYHTVDEIKNIIGADTLIYQRIEDLCEAIGLPTSNLCLDCYR